MHHGSSHDSDLQSNPADRGRLTLHRNTNKAMAGVVYLDVNGTTPVDPRVRSAIVAHLDHQSHFGNPSSSHAFGRSPKDSIRTARLSVKNLLRDVAPSPCETLTFTSGGTESIAWVAQVLSERRASSHFIMTSIEHVAVHKTIEHIVDSSKGAHSVTVVPCDESGQVKVDAVMAAVRPETVGIFVMLANNESGALQPISEIVRQLRSKEAGHAISVHVDGSQAFGKAPIDVAALGCDYLTLAGHKCYSTKGVGALYHKWGVQAGSEPSRGSEPHWQPPLRPLFFGGGQE